jgi:hypothetical protein
MAFTRIWQYGAAVIGYWQFWVAAAFMIERTFERYFPRLAAPINLRFPLERRRPLFIAVAIVAFVYANFRAFDDVSSKLEEANRTISHGVVPEERWPALTSEQAAALRAHTRDLPPKTVTVACETINCRDLADGIADILAEIPGWKVTKLHRGGFDITGVMGVTIEPNEPASLQLKSAIEAATRLKIDVGDETREQVGTAETYITVGSKPF